MLAIGKNIWVSPHDGKWAVRSEGSSRVSKTFDTQSEAAAYGRAKAIGQKSELIIQRPDGRIRSKDSYGNDPCPPKDTEH